MAKGRWQKEYSTTGYDPNRLGYGSGPLRGNTSNSGLAVPGFVPRNGDRFLFRLASAVIPANQAAKILRYRLGAVIGQDIQVVLEEDSWSYLLEREVVSPSWSFIDGNIVWSFRWEPIQESQTSSAPNAPPSTMSGIGGSAPALLYNDFDPTAAPPVYVAPGAGIFPGVEIGGRGGLFDQHGEWIDVQPFEWTVKGPGKLSLMASVRQTDPETRPYLPAASAPNPVYVQGLRLEDQFLLGFGDPPTNTVKYTRILGAFELEHLHLTTKEKLPPCPSFLPTTAESPALPWSRRATRSARSAGASASPRPITAIWWPATWTARSTLQG